jgi:hypothetical protein
VSEVGLPGGDETKSSPGSVTTRPTPGGRLPAEAGLGRCAARGPDRREPPDPCAALQLSGLQRVLDRLAAFVRQTPPFRVAAGEHPRGGAPVRRGRTCDPVHERRLSERRIDTADKPVELDRRHHRAVTAPMLTQPTDRRAEPPVRTRRRREQHTATPTVASNHHRMVAHESRFRPGGGAVFFADNWRGVRLIADRQCYPTLYMSAALPSPA